MFPSDDKLCSVFCLATKIGLYVSMLALILAPTPIHLRKRIRSGPYETENEEGFWSQTSIPLSNRDAEMIFGPSHIMCPFVLNDQKEAFTLTDEDAAEVLKLPNGSVITDELKNYATCRVKSSSGSLLADLQLNSRKHEGSETGNFSTCWCQVGANWLLLFASLVYLLIDAFRCYEAVYGSTNPPKDSDCKLQGKEGDRCCAMLSVLVWAIVAGWSTYFLTEWDDRYWLPTTLHQQTYFRRPGSWTLAVVLAYLCVLCNLIEVVCDCNTCGGGEIERGGNSGDLSCENTPPSPTSAALMLERGGPTAFDPSTNPELAAKLRRIADSQSGAWRSEQRITSYRNPNMGGNKYKEHKADDWSVESWSEGVKNRMVPQMGYVIRWQITWP